MSQAMSFDWATIVEQLLAAGVTALNINGGQITPRVIYHYRRGVQPLHWRGEMMLTVWAKHFSKTRDEAPMCPLIRGHRVDRRLVPGPKLQALPQWPVAVPVSVPPLRKKPGPKPKVKTAEAA